MSDPSLLIGSILKGKPSSLPENTLQTPEINSEQLESYLFQSDLSLDTEIATPEFRKSKATSIREDLSNSEYLPKLSAEIITRPEFSSRLPIYSEVEFINHLASNYYQENDISCDEFIAGLSNCLREIQELINHQEIYSITTEDLITLQNLQNEILRELEQV